MKKHKNLSFLFVIACLPLLVACGGKAGADAGSKDAIDLKFNPEKGATYATVIKTNQNIEMQNMGQVMNIAQEIIFETTVSVTDKTDSGNCIIRSVYDRVYMKQSIPGIGALGENEFDTKDSSSAKGMMAAVLMKQFSKLIGAGTISEMSFLGEVISIDNTEVLEKVGQEGASTGSGNSSVFGVVFKGVPVKEGESWESSIASTVEQTQFTTTTTYTLTAIEDNQAVLDVKGVVKPQIIAGNELQGEIAIEGTQNGTTRIDIATGWTLSSTLKQDLKMEMTQNGKKVPMNIQSTVTVETQKK